MAAKKPTPRKKTGGTGGARAKSGGGRKSGGGGGGRKSARQGQGGRGRLKRWVIIALVILILAALLAVRLDPDRSGAWVTERLDAAKGAVEGLRPGPTWPPELAGRAVEDWTEAQIALTRIGFSPGAISGRDTVPARQAVSAFQQLYALPRTGVLDATTRSALRISEPVFVDYVVTAEDLASITPPAETFRERAQQANLGYVDALEALAERAHSERDFIRALNPAVRWNAVEAGAVVRLPVVERIEMPLPLRYLNVRLEAKTLQAFSEDGRLLFHFPISIGGEPGNRLLGSYAVATPVSDPNYTFRPERFPDAARREGIDRALVLPPGPNNPVGSVWIGLDQPGYGIHGTPSPERIGQTDSLGCFRLTNWDAETLLQHVYPGLPVYVEE